MNSCKCNKDVTKGTIEECVNCQPYVYTWAEEE